MAEQGDQYAGHHFRNIVGRDIHAGNTTNIYGNFGLTREQQCYQAFKTCTYEEYKDRNPPRVDGTCQWVLDHAQFQQWRNSEHEDLLWISADPGCGKSVLAKSLVDRDLDDDGRLLVCYFFFKDNEEQDSMASALCTVLHQLFTQQPDLIRHALPAWENNGNKIRHEKQELWRILQLTTADRATPPVICVFDALDECREQDRCQLITSMCDFLQQATTNRQRKQLKFLVTSRPYDNVQRWFKQTTSQWPRIQLRGEDENEQIHKEINLVIDQYVQDLGTEFVLSESSQKRLRDTLVQMQHRTYLWLHLAIEEIRETYKNSLYPDMVVIESLPQSVEDAYERLLQRVDRKQRSNARQILLIIVGARRPLTVGEMSWALGAHFAQRTNSSSITPINLRHLEQQIRHWCGLFVFIQHSTLFLIHQTAKEFLLSRSLEAFTTFDIWRGSLTLTQVEREMLEICTAYLCLDLSSIEGVKINRTLSKRQTRISQDSDLHIDDHSITFSKYCAEYWALHMHTEIDAADGLFKRILALYDDESELFWNWFDHFWKTCMPALPSSRMRSQHAIAFNGHKSVLAYLHRKHGLDLEKGGYESRTALHWAARRGHVDISMWLIEQGANVNARAAYHEVPLHGASQGGHMQVVQILLDSGADVNAQGDYGSILAVASIEGHEQLVQMLIDNGANINAAGGNLGSALQAASRKGHEQLVRMFLSKGADVNANVNGSTYFNALQAASAGGHEQVVRTLLDRGADVHSHGGMYVTALQAACFVGNLHIVQMLLNEGADVHTQGEDSGTALQVACRTGDIQIVQLLLDSGADVNSQYEDTDTALQHVCYNGNMQIVQMLLDRGADVNSLSRGYGTALHAACNLKNLHIAQVLLDRGADINRQEGWFNTVLHMASKRGYTQMVQMLLDRGADVNLGTVYGKTALVEASARGHAQIVQMLLDRGADVNKRGEFNPSALNVASKKGHTQIVQMLLDRGADITDIAKGYVRPTAGGITNESQRNGENASREAVGSTL